MSSRRRRGGAPEARCGGNAPVQTAMQGAGALSGEAGTPAQQGALPSDGDGTHRFARIDDDRMAELGRLAGGLVHELKNPLGVILLNAELAQGQMAALGLEPTERERLEKRVRRIQDSARSLQSIVQSFLAFTRPTRPDPEAVDLNGLLEELLDEQDDLMVEDGVTVSFHPDPGLPAVAGDRGQLRSVFLNIMTNAREALRGRVGTEVPRKLAVLTRAAQEQARVMLINNGPPIPERVLARLFQPFVSSKEDGTGLGLAIVRRLVELHHGTITASSDPNQGVSFTIEFPTALGPAHARTELPMPEVEAVIRDDAVQVPVVTASDVRKKPRKNTRTTRT